MEDKKLKVFISLSMRGRTSDEILARRGEIITKVQNYFETTDLVICDSFFTTEFENIGVRNTALYWLSRSIEILSDSDVIVMASDWENSRGCRIEYECARLYDIMVIFEDTKYITQDNLLEVDNDSIAGN